MRSLDSVAFDTTGYELQADRDGVRVWWTPQGDGLGLFYYPIPPDIGASLDSIGDLRQFYRRRARSAGLGVLEIELIRVGEYEAVRTLFKMPQQPAGRTYVGSLTFPFRDFSFVLKVQAQEVGITGIRDNT